MKIVCVDFHRELPAFRVKEGDTVTHLQSLKKVHRDLPAVGQVDLVIFGLRAADGVLLRATADLATKVWVVGHVGRQVNALRKRCPGLIPVPPAEFLKELEAALGHWPGVVLDVPGLSAEVTQESGQADEPEVPGPLAALPPLVYAGRVGCVTGYGAAARHQIWFMRKHGARLTVISCGSIGHPDPSGRSEFIRSCQQRGQRVSVSKAAGTIFHMGPEAATIYRQRVGLPRPYILVFVWETSRLPHGWAEIINTFDQVWCPTHWQAGVCAASGVDPAKIHYVPFAFDQELFPADGPVAPRDLGLFTFGSVFQWSERKAPLALLTAFLTAFHKGEPVRLVLRTFPGGDPKSVALSLADTLAQVRLPPSGVMPRIDLVDYHLDHDDLLALMRSFDCYVSSHRGEGYGLPIAEALLLGKPVVATDWSAPSEYAAGLYHPVRYTLTPPVLMGWQPFYSVDQRWAEPSVESLACRLQAAYAGPGLTADARAAITTRFHELSDTAVAQMLSAWQATTGVTPHAA